MQLNSAERTVRSGAVCCPAQVKNDHRKEVMLRLWSRAETDNR